MEWLRHKDNTTLGACAQSRVGIWSSPSFHNVDGTPNQLALHCDESSRLKMCFQIKLLSFRSLKIKCHCCHAVNSHSAAERSRLLGLISQAVATDTWHFNWNDMTCVFARQSWAEDSHEWNIRWTLPLPLPSVLCLRRDWCTFLHRSSSVSFMQKKRLCVQDENMTISLQFNTKCKERLFFTTKINGSKRAHRKIWQTSKLSLVQLQCWVWVKSAQFHSCQLLASFHVSVKNLLR